MGSNIKYTSSTVILGIASQIIFRLASVLAFAVMISGINSCRNKNVTCPNADKQLFGVLADGRKVHRYTLCNRNGIKVSILDYGCIIQSIIVPDRNSRFSDVALGFDSLQGYLKNNLYFGCIVGRYANRIANGEFYLDSTKITLLKNAPPNHLHGGAKGFDKVLWTAKELIAKDYYGLELTYVSPDGDQGYPGELKLTTTYRLTDNNELEISCKAETTKSTILNLTNHTYFNLKDGGLSNIYGHILELNAEQYVPVDKNLIPTGGFMDVDCTPMDFRKPIPIGEKIESSYCQIEIGNGYDHSWLIDKKDQLLAKAATVFEPVTGRMLEVWTTQPAVHLYTGSFLDGTIKGKFGVLYQKSNGFCLETQHFADSPNHPEFPSTILRPGEAFNQRTVFKFYTRD